MLLPRPPWPLTTPRSCITNPPTAPPSLRLHPSHPTIVRCAPPYIQTESITSAGPAHKPPPPAWYAAPRAPRQSHCDSIDAPPSSGQATELTPSFASHRPPSSTSRVSSWSSSWYDLPTQLPTHQQRIPSQSSQPTDRRHLPSPPDRSASQLTPPSQPQLICTCTYVHQIFPAILDRNKTGYVVYPIQDAPRQVPRPESPTANS